MQSNVCTIEELISKASNYISDPNELDKIKSAYLYALEKHQGQVRLTGEDYIVHPLNTAIILTTVYADCDTVCAGLLHDVIEDCDVTKASLEETFGKEVANLVYGVTKISKIHFSTENEALIEYYKKIIVGMSEDVRVIIIKLADRLHNMRTLFPFSLEKQKLKSKETIEILAPIAHHLGIYKIKSELEDLALRYLKPEVFYDIAEKLNKTKLERDKVVNDMLTTVSLLLNEHGIKHEIKGRSKSIYSIYKKLEKGRKFSDIYDLLALRVFVETEQDCYTVLGIIHSKYKPIPKRFKDYIAMPKPNGYQSLHSTVFGIDGYLFEVQIRTHEMDEVAENGVASHWAYKENKSQVYDVKSKNLTEAKLQFFKSIIELNEDKMSSEEFVNSVKDEVLNNNIYVFSPKGDVFELPKGSTPIDFAYRVHTKVGDTMVGAVVNSNIVSLDYELKDDDIVKIITNKNSKPSKSWLKIAKSTQTKNKIKSYFLKNEKEVYIERGKEELEKELRKKKIAYNDFFTDKNIAVLLEEVKVGNLDELYLNIGNGKYSASYVIGIVYKKDVILVSKPKSLVKHMDNNIVVEGIDNIRVNLANCCCPIPGDDIIGYITKGNGISVHRTVCPNLEYLDNRMTSVNWDIDSTSKFITKILIHSKKNENAMLDIMQKASVLSIVVDNVQTINMMDEVAYEVSLWVKDVEQLNDYIRNMNKLSYVESIMRLIQ